MRAKPTRQVGSVYAGLTAHAATLWWLIRDVIRTSPGRVAGIFVLSLIGVTTRLAAIGIALMYVHVQTTHRPVTVRGIVIPADTSPGTILGWGAAIILCAAAAACCTYGADALGFRTARGYMGRAVAAIFRRAAAGGSMQGVKEGEAREAWFLRRLLTRDATMLLRLLLVIFAAMTPVLMFIVATGSLIWVNPWLTAAVAGVLLLYAVPFYLLNRHMARASLRQEEHLGATSSEVQVLVRLALERSASPGDDQRWARAYQESIPLTQGMSLLGDIILSRKRATLLHDVMFGMTLALVLIVYGIFIARNEASWVQLGFYLAALRYASVSMAQVAGALVRVNRFAPQMRRYAAFVSRLPAEHGDHRAVDGRDPESGLEIRAQSSAIPDSLDRMVVEPGERVLCIMPPGLTTWSFPDFCKRLAGNQGRRGRELAKQAYLCLMPTRLPEVTAGDLIGIEPGPAGDPARQEAFHMLGRLGLADEFRRLPSGWSTRMNDDVQAGMSPNLRATMAMAPGILGRQATLVLGAGTLSRCEEAFLGRLSTVIGDRVVVLIHDRIVEEPPDGVAWVVLLDEDGIVGMGDAAWYARTRAASGDRLQLAGVGRAGAIDLDAGDDLDDADDGGDL